jgi:hypothetical protein
MKNIVIHQHRQHRVDFVLEVLDRHRLFDVAVVVVVVDVTTVEAEMMVFGIDDSIDRDVDERCTV